VCRLADFGAGKHFSVLDANRLLHQMLLQEFLEEYGVQSTNSPFPTDMMFVKLGDKHQVREETDTSEGRSKWGSSQHAHCVWLCCHVLV